MNYASHVCWCLFAVQQQLLAPVRPSTAPVSAQNRNSLEGKREEGWEREKEREWGGEERGDRQTGRERERRRRRVREEGERMKDRERVGRERRKKER